MTTDAMRRTADFLIDEAHRCGLVVRDTLAVDGDEWCVPLYDPARYREVGPARGTVRAILRQMDLYAARRDWPRGLPD